MKANDPASPIRPRLHSAQLCCAQAVPLSLSYRRRRNAVSPSCACIAAVPRHRQGKREPAHDRAAVPHASHLKYPIESMRQRLSEGITASHPTMPQFRLEPDQIADVVAYIESLE